MKEYDQAIQIWEGEFTQAYIDKKSREEKHQFRRGKLTEYLQSLPLQTLIELQTFADGESVDRDAEYIQYPRPIHKRERATARALVTLIREVISAREVEEELGE